MDLRKIEIPEGTSVAEAIARHWMERVRELREEGYEPDPADPSGEAWIKRAPAAGEGEVPRR